MNAEYVLITAARNEAGFIGATIQSVLVQTRRPRRWVIVSDRSTDGTAEIVERYQAANPFISLLRQEHSAATGYGAKVEALMRGVEIVRQEAFDYIGILDADITFDPDFYKAVMHRFATDPRLGIAGGVLVDVFQGKEYQRFGNTWAVSGGAQVFRRRCFEDIGDFVPMTYGGEDAVAEVMARMHGWKVQGFPEIKGYHHKPNQLLHGFAGVHFKMGMKDYSYGSHPLFEFMKCLRRLPARPLVVGAVCRFIGYACCVISRRRHLVPPEVVLFVRKEQMERLRSRIWAGRKA